MSFFGDLNRESGDEFNYAALPDDSMDGESICGIDALNSETFGVDIDSFVVGDLEEYSDQATKLQIEQQSGCKDVPSCSRTACALDARFPYGNSKILNSMNVSNRCEINDVDRSKNIAQTESQFDGLASPIERLTSRTYPNRDAEKLPNFPANALTLEEVESNFCRLNFRPEFVNLFPPDDSSGMVLDRRNIRDPNRQCMNNLYCSPISPLQMHGTRIQQNQRMQRFVSPLPFPCFPPRMFMPVMTSQNMLRFHPAILNMMGDVQQSQFNQNSLQIDANNLNFLPMFAHTNVRFPRRVASSSKTPFLLSSRKRSVLPSNRTISDFACNPYAGFMSHREVEWLLKVQELQSQGTGNPYDDDFYHVLWRERKDAHHIVMPRILNRQVQQKWSGNGGLVHHYEPPHFAGSLGKLTSSSTNNPRQLISLCDDTKEPEYEEEKSASSKRPQRKLRTLLMTIENVIAILIECDDRSYFLNSANCSEKIKEDLMTEIGSKIGTILKSDCFNQRFSATLLVRKGRNMVSRALRYCDEAKCLVVLTNVFSALPSTVTKIAANELNDSLLCSISTAFVRLSSSNLHCLLTTISADIFAINLSTKNSNLFIFNLLLIVLCSWIVQANELSIKEIELPLWSWLKCSDIDLTIPLDWSLDSLSSIPHAIHHIFTIQQWLCSKFNVFHGCIGEQIARKLKLCAS